MAQRQFPCPKCGATILVPDDYFKATIACAYCTTVVDRRTGALPGASPTAAAPTAVAPAAAPTQYPGSGQAPHTENPGGGGAWPQYAPPPIYTVPPAVQKKSHTKLIVGVVAGTLVLAVAGVLLLAAIPLLVSSGPTATGEWFHHASPDGGFRIDFPRQPQLSTGPVHSKLGSRTIHRARCIAFQMHFEASYFDLGKGPTWNYEFDYLAAAQAMASEGNGRVISQVPQQVSGRPGSAAIVSNGDGKQSTAVLVRNGNRVFIAICEGHQDEDREIVQRFLESFELVGS